MRKSKLLLTPINISKTAWYYEEKYGIAVIVETRDNGKHVRTTQTLIPWRKLEASLSRKIASKEK